MGTFTADLRRFAKLTEEKMLAVARQSIQDVLVDAQTPIAQGGRMPVDTGFHRNSLASELNGVQLATGAESYQLVLINMQLGDEARFAWTSGYALPLEVGALGREGHHYAGVAASMFPSYVIKNAQAVK